MFDQYFLTAVDYTGTRMGPNNPVPVIPSTPTSLTAVADSDSIVLNWTENGTYDKVSIDRKDTGDYSSLIVIDGGIATYDDTTAVVGVTYTYRVRGTRNGYPSLNSNEASDTVPLLTSHAASNDGTETNYLTAVNPASMRIISTDTFIFGGWISNTDGTSAGTLFTKGPAQTAISYSLDYGNNVPGKFSLDVQKDDLNNDNLVTNNTVVADNTKTFIVGWVDATTVKLAINAGTAASHAHIRTQTMDGGGNVFFFGENFTGYKGVMDNWFFCKNPADMAAAIALINSTVYNSGTGIQYSDLSAGDKTTIGLVSWWSLDEASGSTRADSHGTNDLTLTGTITQVSPLVA